MVLELKSVSKTMGDFSLKDISLSVMDEEYFLILGPSGAGKTILLEIIAGIYAPDAGRILLDGRDITRVPARLRGIGMVYQDYMLFPHLNVEENIGFGLTQRKVTPDLRRKEVTEISVQMGISHLLGRSIRTLSGGEQQRVAIARALVMRPRFLLLDEPLSSLDAVTRRRMREILVNIPHQYGTSILHITHHAEDLAVLGTRSAVIQNGRIVQVGEPDEIFASPCSPFVAVFTGMENLFEGQACRTGEGSTVITVENTKIHAISLLEGDVVVGIRAEDLIFSPAPFPSSARNILHGEVTAVRRLGQWAWVTVRDGISLTGVITTRSLEEMRIAPGSSLYVTFKASGVQVFPPDHSQAQGEKD